MKLQPSPRFFGEITLPGSKTITNRALLMASLAPNNTSLINPSNCADSINMINALTALGVSIKDTVRSLDVLGWGGAFPKPKHNNTELFLGGSGTAIRSLTAALCIGYGKYNLSGDETLNARPIGDLVNALRKMGAEISYDKNDGYAPLTINAHKLHGGDICVRGDTSSQFLSSLLMSAPYAKKTTTITVDGELISKPYVNITIKLMEQFGVNVKQDGNKFIIPKGTYKPLERFWIEGDASTASYFIAGAAIAGGKENTVIVNGLDQHSIQGDIKFTNVLRQMGANIRFEHNRTICWRDKNIPLHGIEINANDIPDAAMTLCPMALFANSPTKITGIASWRIKESNRLQAMKNELSKLGANVQIGEDWINIEPLKKLRPNKIIETYNDHRIAMCFALCSIGANGVPITIAGDECVQKTYPDFWKEFIRIRSIIKLNNIR
jgi:3-phosphoshikimate 1-carboxyvinyltransferase